MTEESEPEKRDRPPVEMLDFVRDLTRFECYERRSHRHPLVMEVLAVPIDAQLQPIAAQFVALTRDISPRGISLVHTARIHAPWLRLKIEGNNLNAILHAKVLRCRRLRQNFEIGCEFVSRIDCGQCVKHEFLARRSPAF